MKKRIISTMIMLVCVVVGLAGLVACDFGTNNVVFKVNFIVDGEVYATVDTAGNETIILPNNPTKNDFTFDGWYWDKDTWVKPFTASSLLNTPLSSDMNVYAKWSIDSQQVPDEQEDVVIKFFVENKILYTYNLSQGDVITDLPIVPIKTGYTGSWSISKIDDVQTSLNVYAIYTAKQYAATLNYKGATGNNSIESITLTYEQPVGLLPTPVKDGYSFEGWFYGEQEITSATIWDIDTIENIEIDAVWMRIDDGHAIISANGYDEQDFVLTKKEFLSNDTDSFDLRGQFTVSNGATWRAFSAASCEQPTEITNRNAVLNTGWNNVYILVENLTTFEQSVYTLKIYKDAIREYTLLSNDTYEATKCDDCEDIIIPEFYNNKKVTSLNKAIFSDCISLKSITIGENVTNIGESAFSNCSSLTKMNYTGTIDSWCEINFANVGSNPLYYTKQLYLNNELVTEANITTATKINPYAFYGYTYLTNITIPNSVTSIGYQAFYNCNELTSIIFGKNSQLTNIGDSAFYECRSLTCINIPNSVTSIGESAFYNCSGLEIITIPTSVTGIGKSALSGCSSLQEITIPFVGAKVNVTANDTYQYPLGYIFGTTSYTGGEGTKQYYYEYSHSSKIYTTYYIPSSLKSVTVTGGNILYGAFYNCSTITSITIPNDVTSIGGDVFSGCSSLTSITIPDGVTSLGDSAFYKCSSLTSITIPDSVTSIGKSAFSGCSSLTSITIPNDVTSIGDYAFCNCSSLPSITIPNSVTSIGKSAFYSCSGLASITIPNGVTGIGDYAFSGCSSLTSITIPNSVTSIRDYAFSGCSSLTSITIPNSVTNIRNDAFSGCSSLTSITIPNSVKSIGDYAFSGCNSLTKMNYHGTIDGWCEISFGNEFSNPLYYTRQLYINNELVTKVNITTAKSIKNYAFYNCISLMSITIPDNVTSIGWDAFYECGRLVEVINKSSINNIASYVGDYVLTIHDGESNIVNENEYTFIMGDNGTNYLIEYTGTETELTLPNNYNGQNYEIGQYAFFNCSELKTITIPNSVTGIGKSAFSGCSSLQEITIPFVGAKVNVTANDTYQYPLGYIFGTTSYTGGVATKQYYYGSSNSSTTYNTYYIPSSLKSVTVTGGNILYGAFYNCSTITSITIPNDVTSIRGYTFYGCSSLSNLTIPDSVTGIGEYAFSSCSNLTSITVPDDARYIGYSAFAGCSSLQELTIPIVGAKVDVIANNTLHTYQYPFGYIFGTSSYTGGVATEQYYYDINTSSKTSTMYYYIPSSLKSVTVTGGNILYAAFYNCKNLTSITILDGVTSIGRSAFESCSALSSIILSESVTNIEYDAFSGCNSLTKMNYTGTIDSWCEISFHSYPLSYTEQLYINNELVTEANITTATKINSSAFSGCKSLTSVTIGDNVTSIGDWAFSGCTSLTSVTIGNSVTDIRDCAFRGCTSLTSVTMGDNVTSIGLWAFLGCKTLTSVTLPDSVTNIGNDPFNGCSKLEYNEYDNVCYLGNNDNPYLALIKVNTTSITTCAIHYDTKIIAANAFQYCKSLTSITIPDGVTSIGTLAFSGCSSLTSITISNGVTSIGNEVFSGCSSLTSVTIPSSVTSIGDWAFSGCSSLTSITIPNSVTSIGYGAFNNCAGLANVYYKGTVREWSSIDEKSNNNSLSSATCYYYSETAPTNNTYNYWHYDTDNVTPVIWA